MGIGEPKGASVKCPHPVQLLAIVDADTDTQTNYGTIRMYCPDCRSYTGIVAMSGLANSPTAIFHPFEEPSPAPER